MPAKDTPEALMEQERLTWERDYDARNGIARPGKPGNTAMVLLQAAASIPQPFSLSELVVACWRANPKIFGLPGFEQFPSDARIRNVLYGKRGLVTLGFLGKTGNNHFFLAHTCARNEQ